MKTTRLTKGSALNVASFSMKALSYLDSFSAAIDLKISVEDRGKKIGTRALYLILSGSHSSEIIEFSQGEKDIPSTTLLCLAVQQNKDFLGISCALVFLVQAPLFQHKLA